MLIAEKFAETSNLYEPLQRDKITFPSFSAKEIPVISEANVLAVLQALDTSKSTRKMDIPAKILKHFSKKISKPLTKIINDSIQQGQWPSLFKSEIVTPVRKVPNPKDIDDLRNISGLMNLNKVMEKVVCPLIAQDMRNSFDKSQFANQPGLSTQHYLIKLIDRILSVTDNNAKGECIAVLGTLVDWKAAFPRQDHTLGIKSFIRNGVRASLIPILASFFEGRSMRVAWRGKLSSEKQLPGGGAQGSSWGVLEYLSQSNNNADNVPESDRAKYMDDLTILEIINLANVGLASLNVKCQVPSNVPVHNQFIPSENLKTQKYLEDINNWTEKNKMQINQKKTFNIQFNFTKDKQFSAEIVLKKEKLQSVSQTKLLGIIITDQLKWNENTKYIVKKANQKMRMLHKFSKFTKNKVHLMHIFKSQVRSVLEYCSTVWHSSLTESDSKDIERIQKAAVKLMMGKNYEGYSNSLKFLKLDSLQERREKNALNFAKKSAKHVNFLNFFPRQEGGHTMRTRYPERYVVNKANTERYKRSAVPYLQRLLNQDFMKQKKIFSTLL